ncbi:MAG TPA: ABC transporter substrate-binding protein [Alphaproteobacteria bacterium]|jgi:branched-chain amino acid transport system substrate-binding protein|nr:ABC transporter substrate-binding protein [Gammaproteobacteria bacterium]MEC7094796.1 ABC transporter substrate-binding protein [Pseudomonadota bacterium]MEC8270375.1 ABC transporter substrate-binding protein [Pseudomonadota bacterium]MEE3024172.1 ABC transporter substrate-binding protein [Pseudomonadota bacterium]HAG23267.1 ABC transporter substrate-binding protein [Alphaproteobacteria bacterium]|tara:strand:+ start:1648 stop:2802 length:1155 start_codon:yes stop_codon:yes gene_type:complete
MKRILTTAIAMSLATAVPALADTVKVGYMTTLSGGAGIIGKQMQNAVNLAMEHTGGKLGGMDAEVIFVDDQRKPDVAKQLANRLVKSDKVDVVAGVIWSNLMMAIHKPVTRSGTLLISSNAGPSPIAGSGCHENFVSMSWQNDQTPEGMGKYMQDAGIKSVYLMAPNYQAGKDMLSGFKRHYKGDVVAEVYTQLGQSDFQAELSTLRAAKPEATFIFQPGGMGINFVKQWNQAGMDSVSKLYTVFTVDGVSLPALKDTALGVVSTQTWSPDLDNAMNKKFVADYKAKFGGYPSFYAAQAYDTMMAIDYAAGKAGSSDSAAMRAVLAKGGIPTTRGSLAMNSNQFPIQNIYLREAVMDADGVPTTKVIGTVFENHGDAYAKDCQF